MISCVGLSPALDVTYLVPQLVVGGIHRPEQVMKLPGGKAFNVARALRTLGRDVRTIVPLGGFVGDLVESLAGDLGTVRVHAAAETRFCVTAADGSALTEVYEIAPALDAAAWKTVRCHIAELEAGWLLLSGSIPSGVPADQIAEALAEARARGLRVAVDVHGPVLGAVLAADAVDLVKVNRHEAGALLGSERDAEVADLVGGLRRRGAPMAVVTDGAAGAVASAGDVVLHASSTAAPAAFPVGSGDSFLAGFIAALADSACLDAALTRAMACGAANAATLGAGRFSADDVAVAAASVMVESRAPRS